MQRKHLMIYVSSYEQHLVNLKQKYDELNIYIGVVIAKL